MLTEFPEVRQEASGYRRFFSDENLQLFFWYGHKGGKVEGFQLILLEKGEPAHAFTWEKTRGSFFTGVWGDDDDELPFDPTPLLVANGKMPKNRILVLFRASSLELDDELRLLVDEKISKHKD